MTPTTTNPARQRKIQFYATVKQYQEDYGISQRDAFRHINDAHVALKGTYEKVSTFERWICDNSHVISGLKVDSSPISAVFEGRLHNSIGADEYSAIPAVNIESAEGAWKEANALAADELREFIKSTRPALTQKVLSDERFRDTVMTFYIAHALAGAPLPR